ncbi:YciI family protein [Luteimicrobium subarcticum]|uniref:YCII-related domain-containing protein n=1 Tax=Luteimicrobium subarcticum TaxID=620910 RepID=A0A2M8W752_9MICO|nr:YciI family protein [Luteimicrobium subarcticum]PJI86760.1 hypothetical protein CLV34_2683 [Luteimicrobium subarcticum]
MKYVVLIHSNPDPWGHPTIEHTEAGRAVPQAEREASGRAFDAMLAEISASGELVTAEALAAPTSSTVYRWGDGGHVVTDGPYAESKEHLAGFFLLDCATRERAESLAARFTGPGDTIELRPAMWGDGEDA